MGLLDTGPGAQGVAGPLCPNLCSDLTCFVGKKKKKQNYHRHKTIIKRWKKWPATDTYWLQRHKREANNAKWLQRDAKPQRCKTTTNRHKTTEKKNECKGCKINTNIQNYYKAMQNNCRDAKTTTKTCKTNTETQKTTDKNDYQHKTCKKNSQQYDKPGAGMSSSRTLQWGGCLPDTGAWPRLLLLKVSFHIPASSCCPKFDSQHIRSIWHITFLLLHVHHSLKV